MVKLVGYSGKWSTVKIPYDYHGDDGIAVAIHEGDYGMSFVHLLMGKYADNMSGASLNLTQLEDLIVALSYGALIMRKAEEHDKTSQK